MRLKAIFLKEMILIARDKRALFLILVFPVFMLILYSYGVTFDIKNVSTAVLDYCAKPASRELLNKINSTEYLNIEYYAENYDDIYRLFLENKIVLALVIPPDFDKKIALGQKTKIQALVNGSDANTASVAMGYQAAIISSYGAELVRENIAKRGLASATGGGVIEKTRIWYNPELISINFIVPGVIAVVMMILGSVLTSTSIVREKETGTIEMLVSTPIRSQELIIGKILPYVIVSFIDIIIVIAIAHFGLKVPLKGSVSLLMFGSLLYLICALGVGLWTSNISNTVSSSQIIVMFLGLLPTVLLSGFIFPISSMPTVVQAITYAFPARYFIVVLRGIFLKGVGLDVLWPQFLFMFVYGLALLVLSIAKFKKKIG